MRAVKALQALAVPALILASHLAQAQDSHVYLGGGIGRAEIDFNGGSFASNSPNITDTKTDTKTGYMAFLGYSLTRNWALEGGYSRLGTYQYKYTGTNALAGSSGAATYQGSAWWLAGKGTYQITDKFDAYGKLGLSMNRVRDSASTNSAAMDTVLGTPYTRNKNTTGMLSAIGAEYHINKQVGLRVEYDDYGKFGSSSAQNLVNLSTWTAAVAYTF